MKNQSTLVFMGSLLSFVLITALVLADNQVPSGNEFLLSNLPVEISAADETGNRKGDSVSLAMEAGFLLFGIATSYLQENSLHPSEYASWKYSLTL